MNNPVTLHTDCAEVICEYRGVHHSVFIDLEDVPPLRDLNSLRVFETEGRMYCYYSTGRDHTLLHRHLMNAGKGEVILFKDLDGLNVRRSNLIKSTATGNSRRRANKAGISGHTGVIWSKRDKKWVPRVCVNYKNIWLGQYASLEEAIEVREKAVKEYYTEE